MEGERERNWFPLWEVGSREFPLGERGRKEFTLGEQRGSKQFALGERGRKEFALGERGRKEPSAIEAEGGRGWRATRDLDNLAKVSFSILGDMDMHENA